MKLFDRYIIFASISLLFCSCSQSGKSRKKNTVKELSISELPSKPNVPLQDINKLTLEELYQENKDAVFLIYTSDGEKYHQGSGFFISKKGIGVSNYHVFEGTSKGREVLKLLNGEQYQIAEVINFSKELDYIVFRVSNPLGKTFSFAPICTESIAVGQQVFTIGNPKGLESTLSTGIISSIRKTEHLIQTTTEITDGSSGGPLFNMMGQVIGITSSGLGEANLNFAVNISVLNNTW